MSALIQPKPRAEALQLFEDHKGLALQIAARMHRRLPRHVRLEELENAALLGLWDAARRFRPGEDAFFPAYAGRRVCGAVGDWLRDANGSAGRSPGKQAFVRGTVSLYAPCDVPSDVRNPTLLAQTPDPRQPEPWVRRNLLDVVALVRRGLSWRERMVVRLYYGEELTMREIAEALDVSESRVSQMLPGILQRCRERLALLGDEDPA